jgi:hypothetical protein
MTVNAAMNYGPACRLRMAMSRYVAVLVVAVPLVSPLRVSSKAFRP